jgi:hypothetical protein
VRTLIVGRYDSLFCQDNASFKLDTPEKTSLLQEIVSQLKNVNIFYLNTILIYDTNNANNADVSRLRTIPATHSSYDPLSYTLFYPRGGSGWPTRFLRFDIIRYIYIS